MNLLYSAKMIQAIPEVTVPMQPRYVVHRAIYIPQNSGDVHQLREMGGSNTKTVTLSWKVNSEIEPTGE